MPNWKSTVDVSDLWSRHKNGSITVNELSRELAARLMKNRFIKVAVDRDDLDDKDLVIAIQNMEDGLETVDDFDYYLSHIYDFADRYHTVWIKTF